MRLSQKIILQITDDADGFSKDFYMEDAVPATVTDGLNSYVSGGFVAPGDTAPVSLPFGSVVTVRGFYVEADGGFELLIDQTSGGTGGYAMQVTPLANGEKAHVSANASVVSLKVRAYDEAPIKGRFVIYGELEVSG